MALVIKGAAVPNSAMATYCGSPLGAVVFNGVRVWPDITGTPLTITNLADEAITWKWTATGSPSAFTFRRSSDGGATWGAAEEATSGKEYELAAGASVGLYAEASALAAGDGDYWSLSASGAHSVSGDATSLLGFDAELQPNALRRLFYADAELTDASSLSLPSATLAKECYRGMFGECTGLASGPALPAATLAEGCYRGMFWKCKSLASAPELPATTLAESCYYYMFGYCTGLTSAPELPATEMEAYCYEGMFDYCKALAEAPLLPAATLATNCYRRMFEGCSVLDHVECMATDISAAYCTELWLSEVADTGTFVKAAGMEDWEVDSASGIPLGWTAKVDVTYFTVTNLTDSAITWAWLSAGSPSSFTFQYSTDWGKTWSESETASSSIDHEIPARGSVCIKTDTSALATSTSNYWRLYATGDYSVSGDIRELLNGSNGIPGYGCCRLFYNCIHLIDASGLTLGTYLYRTGYNCYEMFKGCTGLVKGPTLITIDESSKSSGRLREYCYYGMFQGCTSLEEAPAGESRENAVHCCQVMFQGCTSLKDATKLCGILYDDMADYCCTGMFSGCTALTDIPSLALSYQSVAYCLANTFGGCTSLKKVEIGYGSLTGTMKCLNMFRGCSSLSYVKCLATNISSDSSKSWLDGVAATGTFVKAAGVSWDTGSSGIPDGWTVEEYSG